MAAQTFAKPSPSDMERRKLQNREAQRRYRENIKRKLKMAERQLESRGYSDAMLDGLDVSYGCGNQDVTMDNEVEKICGVDDGLAALECPSPSLDFDWASLNPSYHPPSDLGLLSPSASVVDQPSFSSTSGSTVMHIAARKGLYTIVRILMEAGVDISARDDSGQTPLHLAAAFGHPDIISALIDAGVEVDAKDSQGHTPLYAAVSKGDEASVKTLLESGADPNTRIPLTVLKVGASQCSNKQNESP